ncbi:hydrogenase expression/formation protein HypE [Frankia sp. CNm7]|uniref:Hydrogenase expression/formation protein HypE n=1 Tax=Frankia nepalensis TaxID=1836974 RepID=A0A937RGW3_9ACTN|nr:hydrogenase expression/formation protein HypE [Frankia nepalensis]MBL7510378.1 hydrogenase expression/formation protein HypE [Frankia nepalensis]MBL7524168.1 hydrogenase expression/formation protein HypE [Frankia nepalensis]MBL7629977.1 hydrogenase expression/formation protein HypE [Frankia nepalensis]
MTAETVDPAAWSCPAPLRDSPTVVMGHGGGGALSAELVEHLFLPAFGAAGATELDDCAVFAVGSARLAFSTDSYVVRPLFFPGGSIGELAVNGTVNDLAMSGARPLCLSTAFILEEGTPLTDLARIATAMGEAARAAGVRLATGDTKVVDAGHGHGVFVNTAGIGLIPDGLDIRPARVRPGDAILVSGDVGVHGVAVLSCREGLEFGTTLQSDTAPLHDLVAAMLHPGSPDARADIHALRDPTRGGLAASLNEIARAAGVGVDLVERSIPVPAAVADACGILGLDPLYVANEGKLVAFVAPGDADRVLAAMRRHPNGRGAALIGTVVAEHPGLVVARTAFGATRVVDLPLGEQLPRIC